MKQNLQFEKWQYFTYDTTNSNMYIIYIRLNNMHLVIPKHKRKSRTDKTWQWPKKILIYFLSKISQVFFSSGISFFGQTKAFWDQIWRKTTMAVKNKDNM